MSSMSHRDSPPVFIKYIKGQVDDSCPLTKKNEKLLVPQLYLKNKELWEHHSPYLLYFFP